MSQQSQLYSNENSTSFWNNKRVLITGGSAGLGRSIAILISNLGAKVAIVGRTQSKLDDTAELDSKLIKINADISNKDDIYKISGVASGQLGGIDILINNASSLGPTPLKTLLDGECEDFEDVLQTNLIGPYRLTKAVLPNMILQGNGIVVNISSDAAISAYEAWGFYSVSKTGLDHLSRIWNKELKDQGIAFFSLDPGDMYTDMHLAAIPDAKEEALYAVKQVASEFTSFLPIITAKGLEKVRFSASEWRNYLD